MSVTVAEINRLLINELTAIQDLVMERLNVGPEEAAKSQPGFERRLREVTMSLERRVLAVDLERLDVDVPGIVVDGARYRNTGKTPAMILTMAGETEVRRTTYRRRGGHGGKTVVPLEMRVGLVDSWVTPAVAELLTKFVAQATPQAADELLRATGTVTTSPSTLDRLPKVVGSHWEQGRKSFEERVRVIELPNLPPRDAVAVIAASIDGVMVRMKDAPNTPGAAKGEAGPHGHKEASSATVSLYDIFGNRLYTIALGRMPEAKKVTLREQLEDELAAMVDRYPDARVVAVADAAKENWRIIDEIELSLGVHFVRATDYFHAAEHLADGLKAGGADTETIVLWKQRLRDEVGGAEACLVELARLRQTDAVVASNTRVEVLDSELTYFNNNAETMNYPALKQQNLPIGSGVQEAACKTLVVQRMKQSGMSWRTPGGQAILTLRSLDQSRRLASAWQVMGPTLRRPFQIDPDDRRQRPMAMAA